MARAKTQIGTCVVDGCDKEQYAWHMCKNHQRRLRVTGRTDLGERIPWNKTIETCVIKDCDKKHLSYGFCQAHYKAWIAFCDKHKDPVDWAQFSRVMEKGYVSVYKPNHPFATKQGRILEHRLVMEEMIGRHLKKHENVHHKNGNRKVTIIFGINDQYSGGELYIDNTEFKILRGDMLLFSSEIMHEVKTVTGGVRDIIVVLTHTTGI